MEALSWVSRIILCLADCQVPPDLSAPFVFRQPKDHTPELCLPKAGCPKKLVLLLNAMLGWREGIECSLFEVSFQSEEHTGLVSEPFVNLLVRSTSWPVLACPPHEESSQTLRQAQPQNSIPSKVMCSSRIKSLFFTCFSRAAGSCTGSIWSLCWLPPTQDCGGLTKTSSLKIQRWDLSFDLCSNVKRARTCCSTAPSFCSSWGKSGLEGF